MKIAHLPKPAHWSGVYKLLKQQVFFPSFKTGQINMNAQYQSFCTIEYRFKPFCCGALSLSGL
jgi:hypothetical protein